MFAACPANARFSTPTATTVLPARATEAVAPVDADFVRLLDGSAGISWGRSITLTSLQGLAFNARFRWTAGGGFGGNFEATGVGGILRVNIAATTLIIEAASWFTKADTVKVAVDDTGVTGNNNLTRSYRFTNLAAGASVDIAAPPFGTLVETFATIPSLRNNVLVFALDSTGSVIAGSSAATPLPVMCAQKIRFFNNNVGPVDIGVNVTLGF